MEDVPIEYAMIAWNPKLEGSPENPMNDGKVKIVFHPDRDRTSSGMVNTGGACDAHWADLSTDERVTELLK